MHLEILKSQTESVSVTEEFTRKKKQMMAKMNVDVSSGRKAVLSIVPALINIYGQWSMLYLENLEYLETLR